MENMRHQITFQVVTETQDSIGQPGEAWANIGTNPTSWAAMWPVGGGERFSSEHVHAEATHIFKIRSRADLKPGSTPFPEKLRILFGTRIFDIKHIRPEKLEGGPYMLIEALERLG